MAWEPPYATGVALERKKKRERERERERKERKETGPQFGGFTSNVFIF